MSTAYFPPSAQFLPRRRLSAQTEAFALLVLAEGADVVAIFSWSHDVLAIFSFLVLAEAAPTSSSSFHGRTATVTTPSKFEQLCKAQSPPINECVRKRFSNNVQFRQWPSPDASSTTSPRSSCFRCQRRRRRRRLVVLASYFVRVKPFFEQREGSRSDMSVTFSI